MILPLSEKSASEYLSDIAKLLPVLRGLYVETDAYKKKIALLRINSLRRFLSILHVNFPCGSVERVWKHFQHIRVMPSFDAPL